MGASPTRSNGSRGTWTPAPTASSPPARSTSGRSKRFTSAVPAPLNVLASATLTRRELADVGVARISTGSLLYRAALSQAVSTAVAVREGGRLPDALSYADVQALNLGEGGLE